MAPTPELEKGRDEAVRGWGCSDTGGLRATTSMGGRHPAGTVLYVGAREGGCVCPRLPPGPRAAWSYPPS